MENIGLYLLAYGGIGIGILVLGFYVLDLLTPGNLGHKVIEGNRNAGTLAASTMVAIGLILWFAIFFTGSDWGDLDNFLVYGARGPRSYRSPASWPST